MVAPEALVFNIALDLVGVGSALADRGSVGAAPAAERADAGTAFVVRNIIRIVAIQRSAIALDESWQVQPCAKLDQHVLERTYVAIGRQYRLADRVGRTLRAADRPVQHRNA